MTLVYASLNHALRVPLATEIHSRPFLKLDVPESVTHLAVYGSDDPLARHTQELAQHATLADLCRHFGVAPPILEAKYFYYDFGQFRLKWECHTEFATYTFAERAAVGTPLTDAFARMPILRVPEQWLLGLQGKLFVAAHVVLDHGDTTTEAFAQALPQVFEGNVLTGSFVMDGGELWTDFSIQTDGFSRFVVRDIGMRALQAGRLVQRVLEIETYRMMALLGLPYAQRAAPVLSGIESELVSLADRMLDADAAVFDAQTEQTGVSDRALLGNITQLAARLEKLSLDNSYRFSASKAYFRLVNARIEELREVRIEGIPMVEEFMDRRLTPAMNTCEAILARQDALARRIANSNDLLRTRVGIVQEAQNRKILQAMNARAAQQLQLQQAVEGLSVAAITYYVVGLFSYTGKAAKVLGLAVNVEAMVGILVPFVAAGVWLGLRRMHQLR